MHNVSQDTFKELPEEYAQFLRQKYQVYSSLLHYQSKNSNQDDQQKFILREEMILPMKTT